MILLKVTSCIGSTPAVLRPGSQSPAICANFPCSRQETGVGHRSDTDPGEFFRLQREPVEISDDDRVDYAILEISEGAFPENYEPVSFANRMPDAKDPVFIVSHPSGFRMQIDHDCSGKLLNKYLFSHDCHSTGGSSGPAIFNGNGEMVALHFASGLDSGGGRNRALPVTTIVAVSPLIRGLSSEDSPRYEGEGANLAYADLIDVNLSGTDFTGSGIFGASFSKAWAWHDEKPIGLYAGIIFCVFNPEIHRRNVEKRPDVCARPE